MLGYVPGHAPRPRRRGDRIAGWPKAVAWTLATRHLDPRRLWVTGSPRDQAPARQVHPRKQPSWPAVGPSDSGRSRLTLRSLKPAYPSHSRLISTLSLALL